MISIDLLAFTVFIQVAAGGKYIFVNQVKTIDDAELYCQSQFGTHLASIHTQADNDAVAALCDVSEWAGLTTSQSHPNKYKACAIGLNDKSNERGASQTGWVWSDDSFFDFDQWHPGEPNDPNAGESVEDCVVISNGWLSEYNFQVGDWADVACNGGSYYGYFKFICNAPPTSHPTLHPTSSTTDQPTTKQPTQNPTPNPTTSNPTTNVPTTDAPTVQQTSTPTTSTPTTSNPTTSLPTTSYPTTTYPTTSQPTTQFPTTNEPTTLNPSIYPTHYVETPTENPTLLTSKRTTQNEATGGEGEISIDTTFEDNKLNDDKMSDSDEGSDLTLFYIIAAMILCMCIIVVGILIRMKNKRNVKDKDIESNHATQSALNSQNMSNKFATGFNSVNTSKISDESQHLKQLSSVVAGSDLIMDIIDAMNQTNVTSGGPTYTHDVNLEKNQSGEANEDGDQEIIEMCNIVTNGGEHEINNIGYATISPVSVASFSQQSDYNVMNDNFILTTTKGNDNIQVDEFIVEDDENQTKGYIASESQNGMDDEQEYVTKGNEHQDNEIVDI